jgi:hypothetical protein
MKAALARSMAVGLISLAAIEPAAAQFSPAFLQNASYWRDGKSEIDFYNAEFVRDGQRYQCELLMIFTPGFVEPVGLTPVDAAQAGALPTIRMNQEATLARGLVIEQRSIYALWRMDFMSLARISFTGSDGIGNIAKAIREKREAAAVTWNYSCDSYRGNVERQEIPAPAGTPLFYDELPLRVRTIDFSKASGDFEVQLAPTLISPACDSIAFKTAKISYKVGDRAIEVELKQDSAIDRFVLDRDFPFLLREWKAADGTQLKLKNSIKADYLKYNKPGDRERALKDPMLRHPD